MRKQELIGYWLQEKIKSHCELKGEVAAGGYLRESNQQDLLPSHRRAARPGTAVVRVCAHRAHAALCTHMHRVCSVVRLLSLILQINPSRMTWKRLCAPMSHGLAHLDSPRLWCLALQLVGV